MRKSILAVIALAMLGFAACAPVAVKPEGAPAVEAAPPPEAAEGKACAYARFLKGKLAEAEGRQEEAQFQYEQALICDPAAEYVMRNLAMLLVRAEKRQEAIVWVKRILELRPDDTNVHSLLANLFVSLGETDQAVATYQELLARDPRNQNVMLLLGSLFASTGDYARARSMLEELVQNAPESYAGHYYLAKLYREMRLIELALPAYEKALALNWSPPLAYEAAELYGSAGHHADSARLYRRIVEEDFTDERARGLLANTYLQQNKIDQALAELADLRNITSDPGRVDMAIGRILLDVGRYDAAIAHLRRLLDEDPARIEFRALLVLAYYQKGDKARAKKMLSGVKPGTPGYAEAVLMLARLLQDEKDVAGAEKVLRQAISAAGGDARSTFYAALALLYRETGRPEKGRAVFEEAVQAQQQDVKVLFEYGLFLDRLGDTVGAFAKMQEVLALDPRNPYALNYVGYTWAERGENLEQAKDYIEEAVRQRPEDGFIRDSLGWVYYRLGEFARAAAELEKAVELAADEDPTIYEHLGDVYVALHRHAEAAEAYERAAELYEEEAKKAAVRRKREALPVQ